MPGQSESDSKFAARDANLAKMIAARRAMAPGPRPKPQRPPDPYLDAPGLDKAEHVRRVRHRVNQRAIDARKRRLRRQNPRPKYVPYRRRHYGRSKMVEHPVERAQRLLVNDHRPRDPVSGATWAGWSALHNRVRLAEIAVYGPFMAAHLLSAQELACPRNDLGRWLPPDHTPEQVKPRPRSPWKQASIVPVRYAAEMAAKRRRISNLDLPRCPGCFTPACGPDRPPGAR